MEITYAETELANTVEIHRVINHRNGLLTLLNR